MARSTAARQPIWAGVPRELRNPVVSIFSRPVTSRTLPFWRLLFRTRMPVGRGVSVFERQVGSVPPVRVLVTIPSGLRTKRAAVLWLHGGGMIVGSPQLELPEIGLLTRELDAVVVSPDYRLAPQHPFPAALDDCMATLRWMRESGHEFGIDPVRIAVGGASAGGGLAAAVAQRCRDEGIELRAQVLIYPMLDDRTALRGAHEGRGQLMWTPPSNRFAWTAYLGRTPRATEAPPYAAPARRSDLAGLAPAWIGVGDRDLFYEEDIAYANSLTANRVECDLVTVDGMYHGADGIARKAPSMRQFRQSMLDYLRDRL